MSLSLTLFMCTLPTHIGRLVAHVGFLMESIGMLKIQIAAICRNTCFRGVVVPKCAPAPSSGKIIFCAHAKKHRHIYIYICG